MEKIYQNFLNVLRSALKVWKIWFKTMNQSMSTSKINLPLIVKFLTEWISKRKFFREQYNIVKGILLITHGMMRGFGMC